MHGIMKGINYYLEGCSLQIFRTSLFNPKIFVILLKKKSLKE